MQTAAGARVSFLILCLAPVWLPAAPCPAAKGDNPFAPAVRSADLDLARFRT